MAIKLIRYLFLSVFVVSFVSGCAVNRATANVDPSANLKSVKTIYVVKVPEDKRGINDLIVDKFRSLGYDVSTGTDKPADIDAVVTYQDKWMWDMTMYMIELTIVIRDPKNDFPLATGNSYHTSLTRKSPKEMVNEVVDNIFKKVNKS